MEFISLGQIVQSKAGRDRSKYFIVVGIIDKNYVLVADGNLRTVSNPKKKKIKHLYICDRVDIEIKKMLDENIKMKDSDVRKSIKEIGLLNNKEV